MAQDRAAAPLAGDLWSGTQAGWTELASTRRSIRRYRADPVGQAQLDRILLAATWAPSAHNRQPWRFVVIGDGAARAALATAMGERLRADRLSRGDDPADVAADVARSASRIIEAPALILACLSMRDMDVYPDEARARAEYLMAVQSVAMAVQNLLLAAHSEGLGACIMCAPLFCADAVRQVLQLPSDWEPQNLITLGSPSNAGRPRTRKPVVEMTLRIGASGSTEDVS
jgi:F420 biosynthesis protein FbiB-like protein